MSLQDIRAMRIAGQKPQGVVTVVIGELPKAFRGDALVIQVKPSDQPAFSDWRPLVGCWVAVYNVARNWPQMDSVIEALDKAGAKLYGFVHEGVGYPLAIADTPKTEQRAAACLRGQWELLCQ